MHRPQIPSEHPPVTVDPWSPLESEQRSEKWVDVHVLERRNRTRAPHLRTRRDEDAVHRRFGRIPAMVAAIEQTIPRPLRDHVAEIGDHDDVTGTRVSVEMPARRQLGSRVGARVPARQHLVDFLREDLGLTGAHLGCEHGVCGACTVRVDGQIVRGCLMLAAQADGANVETIEGTDERVAALQRAFHERNAAQCGFCSPAMLITAADLVGRNPRATREEIREHISGNYCRCTGYQAIVDAIESVLS